MREIKFRAWDNKDRVYYLDALMAPVGLDGSYPYDGHAFLPLDGRYIFEQYTGLKDKNGKEIYEGDIVKKERQTTTYTVMWFDSEWVILSKKVDEDGPYGGPLSRQMTHPIFGSLVVIGNIYEHPHLLTS